MKKLIFNLTLMSLVLYSMLSAGSAWAAEKKLVIHVNSADPKTMNMALNNATNVTKYYGIGDVDIEIVVYGPGLKMMHRKFEDSGDGSLCITQIGKF